MANGDDLVQRGEEFDRPGFYLEDDRPNVSLALRWRGRPPTALVRHTGSFLLLAMSAGWLAGAVFVASLPRENQDQLMHAAQGGAVLLFAIFFLFAGASMLGTVGGYWREFIWDAGEGAFTATRRGWLWWGRKTVLIPFESTASLELQQGAERRGPLSLSLRISYRDAADLPCQFNEPLLLPAVLRREQGRKLLFAIARILRAKGCLTPVDNLRTQQLLLPLKRADVDEFEDDEEEAADADEESEAARQEFDENTLRPIPSLGEEHEFDRGEPGRPPQSQVVASGPFDPDSVNKRLEFARIAEWRPGERVGIVQPAAPRWILVTLELIAIGISAAIGAFPLRTAVATILGPDPLAFWASITAACIFGALLAAMLMYNNFRERELTFDWRQKQVSLRVGQSVSQWPMDEIQGLLVAENRLGFSAEEDSPGGGPPQIDCRLDLVLPERDLVVLRSEPTASGSATVRRAIASLGVELAAALETSCAPARFDRAAEVREKFRLSPAQKLALGAIVVAAAAPLCWGVVRARQASQVAGQLAALGVKVDRMGSFTRNDDLICQNYWNVDVKDAAPLAAHAAEVRELLSALPKVGLDAGESNLTDEELAVFRGARLWLADVSQTQITDAGIAALADCEELIYLELYDSRIGDGALAAISRLPRLRYLFLTGTRISDKGLKSLYGMSTLRIVHLGGCPVTPDGVAALREALPGAKIVH